MAFSSIVASSMASSPRPSGLRRTVSWRRTAGSPRSPGVRRTGNTKHVVALVDRSWWPMLGAAIDAVQAIFLDACRREDKLGLATTAGEWVFRPTTKGGRERLITAKIQAANEPGCGIALDASIGMCMRKLVGSGRDGDVSKWLVVFSDMHGGDVDGEASARARQDLESNGVNLIFVNLRNVSRFFPDGDAHWGVLQQNVDAYLEAAGDRGCELLLEEEDDGVDDEAQRSLNLKEHFMKRLTEAVPFHFSELVNLSHEAQL